MRLRMTNRSYRTESGFSLIELLAVVGIIAIMAAVSIPAIGRYIRNYQIRGATQQVASEIQTARNKAIMKNTNLGVVFLVVSDNQYRWVLEDQQAVTSTGQRIALDTIMTNATYANQRGPVHVLPPSIRFATAATGARCVGFTANDRGMRFDRFGRWCDPGSSTPCPDIPTATTVTDAARVMNGTNGSTICMEQFGTDLFRIVTVGVSGRVQAQQ